MDFHTLTRRELQSLCKLNKIPANLTNVAMADALQSLETVVGIEEFLNSPQSETADVVESVEPVEAPSPKAPQTRCRTSTRQKANPTETESMQTTVTRTTRRGSKQLPKEGEETKNDMLKTPAVPRTSSRKAPATTTRRNVNNQLNECEDEPKEEGLMENRYSTRRSTRLTEKKSAAPRGKKGVEKAVKIDSLLDKGNANAEVEDVCNAFEKLDVVAIEEEATHESVEEDEDCGEVNSLKQESNETLFENAVLEDDLKTSEVKIDGVSDVKPESEEDVHKIGKEDEDCDEVNNNLEQVLEDDLKSSKAKIDEVYDLKPDSDDISSPCDCEDENLVQNVDSGDNIMSAMKEHESVTVQEENSDADAPSNRCDDEKFEIEENSFVTVLEENSNCRLELGDDADMEHEDPPCVDTEMVIDNNTEYPLDEMTTKEMAEKFENTVVEAVDAITTMTEEVEDLKPEHSTHVTPFKKATPFKSMTEEVEDLKPEHSTHVTPFKKATPFKSMTEEVEDLKADFFTENNVNEKSDVDSGLTQNSTQATPFKNMSSVVSDDKENIVDQGKKIEKDESEKIMSFTEMSIRQLKKQLKALTLKSHNSKEETAAAATRPALKPLCENQMMVGGETEI